MQPADPLKFAENAGARLAYRVAAGPTADRPPVLLIMGFIMPHTAWSLQLAGLSPFHPVAALDNRGVGQTEAPAGAYSMGLLASDARAVIDAAGWPDAHVVGVSMGGMIAQHFALEYPDRVRSLTLIATHPGGWRARLPPRLDRILRANTQKDRVGGAINLLFPPDYRAACDMEWLRGLFARDLGAPVPLAYKRSQLKAIMGHDTRQGLANLTMPTLVMQPGWDNLIHPRNSERIAARIPNARLSRYPDAGHGIIRQCVDRVNAELLEHFAAADANGLAAAVAVA